MAQVGFGNKIEVFDLNKARPIARQLGDDMRYLAEHVALALAYVGANFKEAAGALGRGAQDAAAAIDALPANAERAAVGALEQGFRPAMHDFFACAKEYTWWCGWVPLFVFVMLVAALFRPEPLSCSASAAGVRKPVAALAVGFAAFGVALSWYCHVRAKAQKRAPPVPANPASASEDKRLHLVGVDKRGQGVRGTPLFVRNPSGDRIFTVVAADRPVKPQQKVALVESGMKCKPALAPGHVKAE
ncbi:hypothetical protein HYH03_016833 [Edaphochlamys debaryana]|uniref:Uncharacterized protein n=1 Tax=Edaphochlamys debaryana TaxID=47281 RepID=A0A836BR46_9CHLO|nr:hypothetical protein HYH03_016833 [Edaphochlamys debaryana]|eukprot:KAG2484419.1 hypothetical protein HYH03_016833 [Edaphochlamys debaryana]